jgi:erythrocyte band 7 integral membrane protein
VVTLPVSLLFVVKVVQEYERAVIFRLGLLLSGGARGPGVFFVIPCVDVYEKIDMRTQTYNVPPQEVGPRGTLDSISSTNKTSNLS